AIGVGRDGSPVDRVVADARTVVRGVYLEPRVTFDAARLGERIAAVAETLRDEPGNAGVEATSDGEFRVVEGHIGAVADPAPAVAAFLTALGEVNAPPELRADLRVRSVEPEITTQEASQ